MVKCFHGLLWRIRLYVTKRDISGGVDEDARKDPIALDDDALTISRSRARGLD